MLRLLLHASRMDTDRFIKLFLTGDSLCKMIAYLCNNSHGTVTDPITNVLHAMITSPLQIMLTQVGVAPFKDRNTLVFPYRLMNEDQKDFLRSFVEEMEHEITGTVASVQIGGGCVLTQQQSSSRGREITLDYTSVLSAFCTNVARSKTHTNVSVQRAVCNIVIQRIGSMVHLDRTKMQTIIGDIPGCKHLLSQQAQQEQQQEQGPTPKKMRVQAS